jgi:hypothetical protein
MNLGDSLSASGARNPRKTAVILGHECLPYEQPENFSESLARWLLEQGYRGTIQRGIRAWLDSGHLNNIVVEFFKPGASEADARWDFPISYSGSGVDDDMWLDKNYLRQIIAKSKRPSRNCTYRVLLCTDDGAPAVDGFTRCSFLSTGQMSARQAGTVIVTGHVTAGATYWR